MSKRRDLEAESEALSDEIRELEEELAQKNKDLEAILNELDLLEREQEIKIYEKERL